MDTVTIYKPADASDIGTATLCFSNCTNVVSSHGCMSRTTLKVVSISKTKTQHLIFRQDVNIWHDMFIVSVMFSSWRSDWQSVETESVDNWTLVYLSTEMDF